MAIQARLGSHISASASISTILPKPSTTTNCYGASDTNKNWYTNDNSTSYPLSSLLTVVLTPTRKSGKVANLDEPWPYLTISPVSAF